MQISRTPTVSVEGRAYRYVKWIWLLSQCAMPVLAVLYVVKFMIAEPENIYMLFNINTDLYLILLNVSGGIYLILWLIAESLLGMYRFPLKLAAAIFLVSGFFLQFIVLTLTGGSPFYAAFVGIYITMAALFASFTIMAFAELIRVTQELFKKSPKQALINWIVALLVAMIGTLPLLFLFPPLWSGFQDLSTLFKVINSAILLINTGNTISLLKGFSIWGKPDSLASQYKAEWERWAPQTIVLLILAVTTAIIVGGIMSS